MELRLLWQFISRWWYLIAIPTAIAILWSLPALPEAVSPSETYGGSIRFSVAAPPDADNIAAAESDNLPRSGTYEDTSYVPWLASEYVVVNMPQWVTGSRFAREVSNTLSAEGIIISVEDVQRAFSADSARSILTIYYGWDDEAELEAIMGASVEVLQVQNQMFFPQLSAEPASIVPLDEVKAVRTVPPLTRRLSPFIRIALGFGVGLGLAVLAAYLDDRVYNKDDLQTLHIEVLAAIPPED